MWSPLTVVLGGWYSFCNFELEIINLLWIPLTKIYFNHLTWAHTIQWIEKECFCITFCFWIKRCEFTKSSLCGLVSLSKNGEVRFYCHYRNAKGVFVCLTHSFLSIGASTCHILELLGWLISPVHNQKQPHPYHTSYCPTWLDLLFPRQFLSVHDIDVSI